MRMKTTLSHSWSQFLVETVEMIQVIELLNLQPTLQECFWIINLIIVELNNPRYQRASDRC